jgi:hypothetical protein
LSKGEVGREEEIEDLSPSLERGEDDTAITTRISCIHADRTFCDLLVTISLRSVCARVLNERIGLASHLLRSEEGHKVGYVNPTLRPCRHDPGNMIIGHAGSVCNDDKN